MRREIVNVWTLLVCATVGCSATACGDSNAVAPLAAARVAGETESGVTALTWNVYLGADIGRVLQARTADLQVPVISGVDASGHPILAGVRWTDGDAVLVRGDVPYTNPQTGLYAASQPVTIGGVTSAVYQGWSSVETTVGGRAYRFVVT